MTSLYTTLKFRLGWQTSSVSDDKSVHCSVQFGGQDKYTTSCSNQKTDYVREGSLHRTRRQVCVLLHSYCVQVGRQVVSVTSLYMSLVHCDRAKCNNLKTRCTVLPPSGKMFIIHIHSKYIYSLPTPIHSNYDQISNNTSFFKPASVPHLMTLGLI